MAAGALVLTAIALPQTDPNVGAADRRGALADTSGAATEAKAQAGNDLSIPVDAGRATRVRAAALVLVDGHAELTKAVDAARGDLVTLGGHTVRYQETEGRPTALEPCPVPVDEYASGGLGAVAFPCPASGEQADSAQLVMAVPVANVERLVRGMDGYGEILGRATHIVDAQAGLEANAAAATRVERQIARLRQLIAATSGDTAALRAQLARKVDELAKLEDRRATTGAAVQFAQVALNLTTVRPPDAPAAHNWFVTAVQTGWGRLGRLAERVVSLLVVVLPVGLVVGLLIAPFAIRRRRRGAATAIAP